MVEHEPAGRSERNVYVALTVVIQAWVGVGLALLLLRGEWDRAFFAGVTMLLTLVPTFVTRRTTLHIPPEFQLVAALFVFLAEYLGTARGFYDRYWWWDTALHVSSGVLLGVVGFLAVFLLNRTDRLPGLGPGFLALFGFTFSVSAGVLWEVYEFLLDELVPGMNAQSRETGVVDTMVDLVFNVVGAALISLLSWAWFRSGRDSLVVEAIRRFLDHNPRWFRSRGVTPPASSPPPATRPRS